MQQLILIRGIPGSGKSTFANMLQRTADFFHYEADQLFTTAEGDYEFDPLRHQEAHDWCQLNTIAALRAGHNVVVANTFTRIWEMQPYFEMADKAGAQLTVLTVEGNRKSIHNVPQEVLNRMKQRWETYQP